MTNPTSKANSEKVTVTLSKQSIQLLDDLAEMGIYGLKKEEVAARLIDKAFQQLVETPILKLNIPKRSNYVR